MNAVFGVLVEAWGEVRVHRARVVLSLVGVFLAVFAMTIITAAGDMARQSVTESAERNGGRTTTLSLYAYPANGIATPEQVRRLYTDLVQRFDIAWSATVVQSGAGNLLPPRPDGAPVDPSQQFSGSTTALVVDPAWATIHRVEQTSGRFLVPGDAARMLPAVVLNGAAAKALGTTGRATPYDAELVAGVHAVVVGTIDRDEGQAEVVSLPDGPSWLPEASVANSTPSLEMWVPAGAASALKHSIDEAVQGQGWTGEASVASDVGLLRTITAVQWGIRGISLFALLLGAIGVLNVGVVTVRQRVREIGVRRALGASSRRVFAAIMLESVVATALAGALGVAIAVAIVVNLPVHVLFEKAGITDVPPFPARAAVEAFVAATLVGALAGLIPATIAVRSKVIDAIRY